MIWVWSLSLHRWEHRERRVGAWWVCLFWAALLALPDKGRGVQGRCRRVGTIPWIELIRPLKERAPSRSPLLNVISDSAMMNHGFWKTCLYVFIAWEQNKSHWQSFMGYFIKLAPINKKPLWLWGRKKKKMESGSHHNHTEHLHIILLFPYIFFISGSFYPWARYF